MGGAQSCHVRSVTLFALLAFALAMLAAVVPAQPTAALCLVGGLFLLGCAAAGAAARARRPRDTLMELAGTLQDDRPPPADLVARAERIREKMAVAKVPRTQDEQLARLDTTPAPRFDIEDPAWLAHLDTEGFAVVAGVASPDELERAHHLLWEFLEDSTPWRRDSPGTWSDEGIGAIGMSHNGIVNGAGVGQSDFLWSVRTLPKVRRAFERIWDTTDLLVSFDGANVFRPWHHGFRKTLCGWWHVDQGGAKVGRHAVQGLVSLFDGDGTTGGLTVVPGSHLRHREVVEDQANPSVDFCSVQPYQSVLQELPHRLVACRAGDLVLWDSRTVHANSPAVAPPTAPGDRLLRAAAYVCMTPKRCATAEVRQQRRIAFEHGFSTSHWPHELRLGSQRGGRVTAFKKAPKEVQELVG